MSFELRLLPLPLLPELLQENLTANCTPRTMEQVEMKATRQLFDPPNGLSSVDESAPESGYHHFQVSVSVFAAVYAKALHHLHLHRLGATYQNS